MYSYFAFLVWEKVCTRLGKFVLQKSPNTSLRREAPKNFYDFLIQTVYTKIFVNPKKRPLPNQDSFRNSPFRPKKTKKNFSRNLRGRPGTKMRFGTWLAWFPGTIPYTLKNAAVSESGASFTRHGAPAARTAPSRRHYRILPASGPICGSSILFIRAPPAAGKKCSMGCSGES